MVSFQAAGSCVLDANQAGNGTYNAAPQVQQTFTVGKGNQTITFTSTAPGAASVGGATYTAAATASSGLTVTFTSGSTTVCTSGGTNGSVFTFVGNGTCIVDANQVGNGNYNAAPQVQQNFGVKHSQTITFTSTAPGAASVGGATYTPAATATSALAVTITVDASSTGICSINGGGVVSFQSPGSCVLDANQTGNTGFYAAPQVQQSFTVSKGNQTITFTSTAPGAATVGGATYTPAATASSGLTVTITIDASSTGCSINGGGVVSFQSAGTCIVDANQAGNGNYNGAPQVQQNFTVNKNNQTITFTSTAPGAASVGGATYTPAATATSGLAVTITVDGSSAGICSINGGGVVSFQAAGSCVLDANQTGNGTYNAAPQVQQTFTVGKGNQTITFTSTAPGAASVGGATYTAAATASSGLTVTFTSGSTTVCTSGGTNGSVFTFVGNGTCIVDANQVGNGNYNAAHPGAAELRRQAQPDDHLHLHGTGRGQRGRGHLHPRRHRHLGPRRDHHRRCLEHRLLPQRRRGQLHVRRLLRPRRQPSRQHRLLRGAPGPAELHGYRSHYHERSVLQRQQHEPPDDPDRYGRGGR